MIASNIICPSAWHVPYAASCVNRSALPPILNESSDYEKDELRFSIKCNLRPALQDPSPAKAKGKGEILLPEKHQISQISSPSNGGGLVAPTPTERQDRWKVNCFDLEMRILWWIGSPITEWMSLCASNGLTSRQEPAAPEETQWLKDLTLPLYINAAKSYRQIAFVDAEKTNK